MSETTEKRTRKSNSAKSVDETMVQDAPSAVESATSSIQSARLVRACLWIWRLAVCPQYRLEILLMLVNECKA